MTTLESRLNAITALELFARVRRTTNPIGATFISELDDHIAAAFDNALPGDSTLVGGELIEVQGPAASGKTQFLQFITLVNILPCTAEVRQPTGASEDPDHPISDMPKFIELGGRNKAVVICDCDGRWSLRRLASLVKSYLSVKFSQAFTASGSPQAFESTVQNILEACMQRVHIFRPTSSTSLNATLFAIPSYCQRLPATQHVSMLLVDSLSAFFHADTWKLEQSMTRAGSLTVPAQLNPLALVLSSLQNLRDSLGLVIFVTNWALITTDGKPVGATVEYDSSHPFYGQHLTSPYPDYGAEDENPLSTAIVTHHITLAGTEFSPPQFSNETTLSEALLDQERLAENRVTLVVRTITPSGMVIGSAEFGIREDSITVE